MCAQEYKFSFSYGDSGAVTMNLNAPGGKKKGANVPLVRHSTQSLERQNDRKSCDEHKESAK